MQLDNETTLASYLTAIQTQVRKLASLDFERRAHPDFKSNTLEDTSSRMELRDLWMTLEVEMQDLLGLELRSFGNLAEPGTYHTMTDGQQRCLRWNFGKLKKMADKHRRKHPEFKFLKSWDYEAKRRTKLPHES